MDICCLALGWLLSVFGNVAFVPRSRLDRARGALTGLVSLDSGGSPHTPEQIQKVRSELVRAASLIRRNVHPRSRRGATHYVTHLNSAEHLDLHTVEEIGGDDWLDRLSGSEGTAGTDPRV